MKSLVVKRVVVVVLLLSCHVVLYSFFCGLLVQHRQIQRNTTTWKSSIVKSAKTSTETVVAVTELVVEVVNGTTSPSVGACLTAACLETVGRHLARAFPNRPKETWCIPSRQRGENSKALLLREQQQPQEQWQGILLVKVYKAASSTSAGVALRIANRTNCAAQWSHRPGREYQNKSQTSFLFAPVRNPATRALSSAWFFHFDSHNMHPIQPTDDNVLELLRNENQLNRGGLQFNYLTPHMPGAIVNPAWLNSHGVWEEKKIQQHVQDVVNRYDFLMVVERMNESLVALAMLMGLDNIGDVLVQSSKQSGQYIYGRYGRTKGKCHKYQKEKMSENVTRFMQSTEFVAMNYADELLWRAVNASLDRTIEQTLGRNRFDKAMMEYKRLQNLSKKQCGGNRFLGCTDDGKPFEDQDECYFKDFGCGFECIDEMLLNETATRGSIRLR